MDHTRSRPTTLREWCVLACRRTVVIRGLKFAVVVGAILITINHGDAILRGQLDLIRYLKMGLTVMVPYVVSVFSSVGAMVENGAAFSDQAPGKRAVRAP
jgi:hypothetical protein